MTVGTCRNCKKKKQQLDIYGNCKACGATSFGQGIADYTFDKLEEWAKKYVSPTVFRVVFGSIFLLVLYVIFA
ncbi:MAG: hypothetical protein GY794_23305 [bacterium]|jgi:hypothetical protein|uniref:Uncharacterized protein n=1 Tax=Alteromonas alba TaxID=2079529 RepID=A0A2S9VBG5_9ALTE|nr:hypothetical protein CDW43_09215 [Methylophaga nitratireducenticrescens]MCP4379087.1 hypothetical protein [bacterium]MCW8879004.1 hypothetical protein [Kangiellaceae bacterium]PRO73655.1 hypothetical protein C6Y40_10350 [Alteromonas alba]|tara:strand:+ start:9248 stop:9466 length:219 start_codon:yes stop_codon:yes gene_type:complete